MSMTAACAGFAVLCQFIASEVSRERDCNPPSGVGASASLLSASFHLLCLPSTPPLSLLRPTLPETPRWHEPRTGRLHPTLLKTGNSIIITGQDQPIRPVRCGGDVILQAAKVLLVVLPGGVPPNPAAHLRQHQRWSHHDGDDQHGQDVLDNRGKHRGRQRKLLFDGELVSCGG